MAGTAKITDLAETIGQTPMVRLPGIHDSSEGAAQQGGAEIVGKLEYMNPGCSIKDRVAKHIVRQLDARGVDKGALLVVAGPGNLAVSLAMLQRRLVCLVPERTSADRVRLLKAAGAVDIVRTLDGALPGAPEHPASIGRRLVAQAHPPGSAVYVDEEEAADWDLAECYEELAAEIVAQTDGRLGALVLGVDTGCAATHLSRALRARVPGVQIVGVEPSAVGDAGSHGAPAGPLARRWLCEDIGRAYPPRALDPAAVDMWVQVTDKVAYSMARRLVRAGVAAGPASGAAVAAARTYAVSADALQQQQQSTPAKVVVVILGDSARNYGETLLSDDWMLAHDLLDSRMLREIQLKQTDQYRAASVEDLQLPAAVAVAESDPVGAAIELMAENDFSQVPVTGPARRLVGYLPLSAAQTLVESGRAKPADPVARVMLRFTTARATAASAPDHQKQKHQQYWLITPETPLSELARFFETHTVAFVTDASRKFCLGIATKQDLMAFLARRGSRALY
ncbi:hypothetical protein GGI11_001758 [Coemansia sp. RSA 2049]|nr:hypothetical protein GGI11_001758 [Coemansia sp. RSA 2049]